MRSYIRLDSQRNEDFIREARRALTIEEINESAGMKYLIAREIEACKNNIAETLKDRITIKIVKEMGDYIIQAELKGL